MTFALLRFHIETLWEAHQEKVVGHQGRLQSGILEEIWFPWLPQEETLIHQQLGLLAKSLYHSLLEYATTKGMIIVNVNVNEIEAEFIYRMFCVCRPVYNKEVTLAKKEIFACIKNSYTLMTNL